MTPLDAQMALAAAWGAAERRRHTGVAHARTLIAALHLRTLEQPARRTA